MSEFDPYRKWLGIKPEEQPPNHYRLLGVSLYEDDPDVIDAAVEQRVTFLQTCASGPNLKHSQQILNEVAEARNVLLNEEQKEAYDDGLKAKLEAESAASADAEGPSGEDQPTDSKTKRKRVLPAGAKSAEAASDSEGFPGARSKLAGSVAAQFRLRRNRSTGLALAVLFGVAATVGLLWWLLKGDGTETLEELAQEGVPGITDPGPKDSGSGISGTVTTGETSTGGNPVKGSTGEATTPPDSTGTGTTKTNPDPKTTPRETTGETTTVGSPATKAARDAGRIAARESGIAAQLAGHTSAITAVAISGDLNTVASAGEDGTVLVHSLADSDGIVDQFKVKGPPLGVSFNSQGSRIAVLTANAITFRDFREKKLAWQDGPHPDAKYTSIAHRSLTPFFLVGHLDGNSVLRGYGEYFNAGGRPPLAGHTAPVTSVAVSASGRIAVTASEDKTLRVWHVESKAQLDEFRIEVVLKKVAISPDERRIVAISELGLHTWDLHNNLENPVVPVHDGLVSDVALLGDQPFAVTSGLDGTIQVVDLETLLPTLTLSTSSKATRHLAVTSDGVAAVTAGVADGDSSPSQKVLVWRLPESTSFSFGRLLVPDDLLAHVDLKRDIVQGTWTHKDGLLVSGTDQFSEVHVPATVPEEYTLDLRVRRTDGSGLLRIYLPFQDTVGSLVINADRGHVSGLEYIDGVGVEDNGTGFRRRYIVSYKQEHTIRATVTKEGIKASVDGTVLFDWKGTSKQLFCDLKRDPDLPVVREIRLVTSGAQYAFSSIQLLPPGGEPTTGSTPPLAIVERIAAPADAEIQTEIAKIRADLAGAYADTKNRQTLIAQLIRMANDAKDAPATQCAAWSEAASLASEGGDATQAFLTLDRMSNRFDGSFFELKEKVFSTLLKKRDGPTSAQLALFGFSWAEDLIDGEQFDEAASVLSRTRSVTIRLNDARLRELADYLTTRIRILSRGFAVAKDSAVRLSRDPDDAAAAEVVGRFRCFTVEDWERGLPLLVSSKDATLKQLAEQDLTQPTAPDEQVALADAWWAYSTKQPVGDRDAIRRRAGVWYIQAIRSLPQIRQAEVRQKELKVPSESAHVSIAAQVDAGDSITIRRDGAVWKSPRSDPANVHINKFPWDVKADNSLPNRGATRFLPHGIHFGRVRLQKLQGQVDVNLSVSGDEIILKFNDDSSGAGTYQLLLSFGS